MGNFRFIIVPHGMLSVIQIFPPIISIASFDTARPSPVPASLLFVKHLVSGILSFPILSFFVYIMSTIIAVILFEFPIVFS